MMKIIVWNCRGAASKGFATAMRNLCMDFKPDVVVLLEPRVSGVRGQKIIKSLGFGFCEVEKARGFAGGIWVMWKEDGLDLRIVKKHEEFMHVFLVIVGRRCGTSRQFMLAHVGKGLIVIRDITI